MPLVSIIVPVYNGSAFLERCLASIEGQTFRDWECLMVNDGSTDESPRICQAFAQRDERFVFLEKENGGVSAARNFALERARGRYLMFSDQDDVYAPTCVEEAVACQQQNPKAMVRWPFIRVQQEFDAACAQPQQWESFAYKEVSWHSDWFHTVWNRIYDMDTVQAQRVRFDPELGWWNKLGEDVDFNKKYIDARWPEKDFLVCNGSQPRYFYFPDNPDSVTVNLEKLEKNALPPPEKGYCARLLLELSSVSEVFRSLPEEDAQRDYILHFIRCMAFGIWSARQLGEPLPKGLFRDPRLLSLLDMAKRERLYSVYTLPFRWRQRGLIARLYAWDEGHSIWYWRFYEAFYRLFCRGWKK